MAKLGTALADLHEILAGHPERKDWARTTRSRLSVLSDTRTMLASGAKIAGPHPDRLRALASRPDLDFCMWDTSRRPLHGDLNRGNLYFDADRDAVSLIDFEDVQHSDLPPIFELAFLIERHITAIEPEEKMARDAGQTLWQAYRAGIEPSVATSLRKSGLGKATRSINLRSLCVLALLETEGATIPQEEWQKFFDLFDFAERNDDLYQAIMQA